MSSLRFAHLSVLLAVSLASSDAAAGEPVGVTPAAPQQAQQAGQAPAGEAISIHEAELRAHEAETRPPRIVPEVLPTPRGEQLARVVYGYYPFWVADLTTIRWEGLTHLAWFSVDLNGNGDVVSTHGWPDPEVVEVAHAAGVRVDLTFTLFGGADIESLCTSPAKRASTIDTMVTMMEQGGADGISVDFEFVNGDTRAAFVSFIDELRSELDARGHNEAEISIAGPTVDWAGGIDLDALLDRADWYFVMGYGYFWSGSANAGPGGMLRVTPEWAPIQSQSMLRTIATYSGQIDAEKRRQLIWGVPYYGRRWRTTSGDKGAATVESLGAVTYTDAVADLASGLYEPFWDEGVKNPWYRRFTAGSWQQVYHDDAESLAAKYDLAMAQDLGGVGMWALNYDKPHSELWDLLEERFTRLPEQHPEGHRLAPIAIDNFPFHDARDTAEGPSHYFNYYDCAPETPEYGREWVYAVDVCQPGTITAAVPEYADRDPDLHLLSQPDQDTCLARGHTDLTADVPPGRYLLVVDTFVDTPVEQEGPYELDVDFVPEPGSEACAEHLVCDAGDCRCPEAGHIECGGACVDASEDPAHCGACDNACVPGASCVAGSCETSPAPPDDPAPILAEGEAQASCSCRAPGNAPSSRWGLLLVGAAMLGSRRLRRKRAITAPPRRLGGR